MYIIFIYLYKIPTEQKHAKNGFFLLSNGYNPSSYEINPLNEHLEFILFTMQPEIAIDIP